MGRITVPLIDLMLKPNKIMDRNDKLMGYEGESSLFGLGTESVLIGRGEQTPTLCLAI